MRTLLLLPLIAFTLRADAPAELRTRLTQLQGQDPVKGSVERQIWQQDKDGKEAPKVVSGSLQVRVEDGPQGLQLQVGSGVLAQARKEQEATLKDPEREGAMVRGLKGMNPLDLAEGLNAAQDLLRDLAQATFLEAKAEAFEGQPARLLLFKPEPKLNAQARKAVKSLEATLKVWVAPDGTPLAMEEASTFKASRFFVSFEGASKVFRRYRTVGSRLVVVQKVEESSNAGLGAVSQRKTVTKFAPA